MPPIDHPWLLRRGFVRVLAALLLAASTASGECNVCSTNGLACVSGTQYQVCVDGVPQGTINDCPGATVCSTVADTICATAGGTTVQACQDCNTCDATNTFACTGSSTFSLCLGTTVPSQFAGSCESGYVCSILNEFICGDPAAGVVPTCSLLDTTTTTTTTTATTTTTTTTTTVSPLTNSTAYCQEIEIHGRFPVGTNVSTTCRQYVHCFLSNGVWTGQVYQCPGTTYFNSGTGFCQLSLPARCLANVRSLSLADIALD